jgi:hypothetical protein
MEPEGSLPYSQVPRHLSRLYPVPTPHSNFMKIHLNIILQSTSGSPQRPLSLWLPHQHPVHTSLFTPCAPHDPPISFFSILPPAQYWVRNTHHSAPHYVTFSIPLSPCRCVSTGKLVLTYLSGVMKQKATGSLLSTRIFLYLHYFVHYSPCFSVVLCWIVRGLSESAELFAATQCVAKFSEVKLCLPWNL